MKTKSILVAGWIAVVLATTAQGQFVPGHVFAAQQGAHGCNPKGGNFGSDRIWEINPETGQATLFVDLPVELCGLLTGLAFTPDGSRLRGASYLRDWIMEFDSEGNMTIALDVSDGIACPWEANNLAYDADGNFYVANACTRNILRFPADGGPATVFADETDGIGLAGGPIAVSADGDLYFGNHLGAFNNVLRFTGIHQGSVFDAFEWNVDAKTITADHTGHVYVALDTAEVFRYDAGDPESKELLTVLPIGAGGAITMSPDQTQIYVTSFGDSFKSGRVLGVDVLDGTVTILADFSDGLSGFPAGIAVVPVPPPPIPTLSGWSVIAMTLLVLTAGTTVLIRCRGAQP